MGRPLETGQHVQRGCLARSRWAEQRKEFALSDIECEVPDGERVTIIALPDADELDERIGIPDLRRRVIQLRVPFRLAIAILPSRTRRRNLAAGARSR